MLHVLKCAIIEAKNQKRLLVCIFKNDSFSNVQNKFKAMKNKYNTIRIRKSCCRNIHAAMLEINSNVLSLHGPKSAQSVIIYWLHDLGLQYYCNDIISNITCDTLKQERIVLSLIGVRLMVIVSRETGESNLHHV